MKRMLSLLLAVCLSFSVATSMSSFAATIQPEMPAENVLELTLLSTEATARGIVKTFSFNLPADGEYYYFPDFEEEYQSNTSVTFIGTWSPSYEEVTVRLIATATGGGQIFTISSGVEHTRTLYVNSVYTMQLRVVGQSAVRGTLQVTIT